MSGNTIPLASAILLMRAAIEEVSSLTASLTPLTFSVGNFIMSDVDCSRYALAIPSTGTGTGRDRDELTLPHTVVVSIAKATHEETDALAEIVVVEALIIGGMMRRDLMYDAETGESLRVKFLGIKRPIIGNQYLISNMSFIVVADLDITYEVEE